jgi:hypothetical protein
MRSPRFKVLSFSFSAAVQDTAKVFGLENCIEDIIGSAVPTSDKPYKAYRFITEHWKNYCDIPETWRHTIETAFEISIA